MFVVLLRSDVMVDVTTKDVTKGYSQLLLQSLLLDVSYK
jgi:hypothetical protein